MLNLNNSIGTHLRPSGTKTFLFNCSSCFNVIKSEKKYLDKHSGKCRYCVHKGIPYLSSFKHLKDNVERTNKKRKKQKSFNLTFNEFLEFTNIQNCHYCNDIITWVKHTGTGQHKYNLDRKDSNLGYTKNNLVVCCKNCNIMKRDMFSYDEFKKVVSLLDKLRNGNFIKKGWTNE